MECNETCRFWQNCVRPHLTDIKTNKSYYLRCLIDLFHRKSLFWLRKKLTWNFVDRLILNILVIFVWLNVAFDVVKVIVLESNVLPSYARRCTLRLITISFWYRCSMTESIAFQSLLMPQLTVGDFFLCCCRMKFSWLIVCFKRQWKRNITRLWWNHD